METRTTDGETHIEDDKTLAIVAYLTIIGLVAAFVMNRDKKDEFAAYHIRQSLGLCVCGIALFVVGLVPVLGWIVSFFGSLFLLYLWIMGLINAINGRLKAVPFLGEKFQEWFKDI
ncbi:hypothetical protein RM553_08200 [Zunongwangia sp. F363]|uniref:Chloroplast import component protein (Tic20) n=1 Tax=Autumnicola tepida TaxID=3075595 RepID=A0ABU3C913_9FLAO|nr:hypothetical protein [Zunongwangia sp. F363]MDT0642809.1 hypothetical protein [Zunongwangia sp. F363]